MTELVSTAETVRKLVALVVENSLEEISIVQGEQSITVKGIGRVENGFVSGPSVPLHYVDASRMVSPPTSPVPSGTPHIDHVIIESPMVGVFYRSPSPDDPSYVEVGDIVQIGQTIGLIEAMKVYSEVPSEVSGRIVRVAVENGALVQMGQPIFYLERA